MIALQKLLKKQLRQGLIIKHIILVKGARLEVDPWLSKSPEIILNFVIFFLLNLLLTCCVSLLMILKFYNKRGRSNIQKGEAGTSQVVQWLESVLLMEGEGLIPDGELNLTFLVA